MSRSRWKSHNNFGRFGNCVCYFSNKKDKRIANQSFRQHNRQALRSLIKSIFDDDYKDTLLYNIKECSDVWSFSSDGLKHYIGRYSGWYEYSDEEWNEYARK